MARPKLTFEQVKVKFEERGYELLETEYVIGTAKMRYKCPHHPDKELSISYAELRNGSGCRYCGILKRRHSFELVKETFEKRGYKLLEKNYVNDRTKMQYKCPHHPNEVFTILFSHLRRGHGCPKCGQERSGQVRSEAHFIEQASDGPSIYTKEQRQKARQETSRLLDMYCYDCPNKDLPYIGAIEEHCYKNCPHGIGLDIRRCGAILAGEDADAIIEHYKVKFEKERIDSNSRKEALVNE
ncbi:DUF723 domain-containing protein [Bacillus thuringiensis]|uniref:DUF723 domain-containing protein n=1 Tax=Bacillus thuringiensis TaxID=1428 RepID=UPI000BF76E3A|nr:DUF723 domain-containing protein [Bacillus thuringiensis]PFS24331.1 DUF723 domain-containing protein [Bacillus thuringiensis]